jgi:hypothetical protein
MLRVENFLFFLSLQEGGLIISYMNFGLSLVMSFIVAVFGVKVIVENCEEKISKIIVN